MGFIDLEGIGDVKEKDLIPVGTYDFVIDDVKSEPKEGGATGINLRCSAVGMSEEDYQPVFHYLTAPGQDHDKDAKAFLLLSIKRFCHIADVPLDGGLNEEDLMGATFNCAVDADEYEDRETRKLKIPNLPTE